MSDGSDSDRAQERSDRPQRPPAPTSPKSQYHPRGCGSRQAALTGRKDFDTLASAAFDRHPHRRSGTVLPQGGGKASPTAAAPLARSLSKPISNPSREEGAAVGGPSSAQGADNDGDVVGVSEPTRSAERTIGLPVNVQRLVQDLGTPRGMVNFGNTCFMASVLQVLIRVSPLARYLLEEVDAQSVGGRPTDSPRDLMDAMMDLAKEVHRTTRTDAIEPTAFHRNMSLFIMGYEGNTQQDSNEYLGKLIEGITRCCLGRKRQGEPNVSQMFTGLYENQLKCQTCGYKSSKPDVVNILNLEMPPSIDSLDGILQNYTKKEDLLDGNRWECHKCETRRDTIKRTTVVEPPNVLVASLNRFEYIDKGGIGQKITAHISFDTELQLWLSETEEFCLYDLSGVIVHKGPTASSGHYVSYVKTPTGTWVLMNDEEVRPVTWAEVRRQQVYVFVYTRRVMKLPASSASSLAPPSTAAAAASAVATGGKTADATSSVGCGISSRHDRARAETSDGVPSVGATAPVVGSIGKRGREGDEGEGEGKGSADVGPFAPEHREEVSANTPAVPLQPTKRQRLGICERDVESRGASEGHCAEDDDAARLVAEALLQLSSPWKGPVVASLQQAREPSVTTPERQAEATAPDDTCGEGTPNKRARDEADEIGGGVGRAGGAAGCHITKRIRPSAPIPGANS